MTKTKWFVFYYLQYQKLPKYKWGSFCEFYYVSKEQKMLFNIKWRKLSAEKLMLLNCGVGEDSRESLGLQGDPTSPS